MKRLLFFAAFSGFVALLSSAAYRVQVSALVAIDPNAPPALSSQDIIISAVPFGPNTSFVEIYNQTDKATNMSGRYVKLVFNDPLAQQEMTIKLPDAYLLPDGYASLSLPGVVTNADMYYDVAKDTTGPLKSVYISDKNGIEQLQLELTTPSAAKYIWLQRKSGDAGQGTQQSSMTQKENPITLRGFGVYKLPALSPTIKIVEVLASRAECAPNDASIVCDDYVKLYNPTNEVVDLSSYRLRSDSGTSLSNNVFSLNYRLDPQSYLTIHQNDDGDPMSLTNSGGYVWLEDVEGILKYDETITKYADASSTAKTGWSWIWDGNEWAWTSTPQPDAPNLKTVPVQAVAGVATEQTECPAGKYRSQETNRCRTIEDITVSLVACDKDQYRSSETNRCRNIATAAVASLSPCDEGKERNPSTNRCRSIVSTVSTLPPCDEDYERNPSTNRCRKVLASSVASVAAPVKPEAQNISPIWLGGSVLLGAIGYAIYEWRFELSKFFKRFAPITK